MTAASAGTTAAEAAVTTGGWASCSVRRGADRGGLLGAASGALKRGTDLGGGQPCGRGRVRRPGQQLQGVGGVQVLERLQRGREEVPKLVAQPPHRRTY